MENTELQLLNEQPNVKKDDIENSVMNGELNEVEPDSVEEKTDGDEKVEPNEKIDCDKNIELNEKIDGDKGKVAYKDGDINRDVKDKIEAIFTDDAENGDATYGEYVEQSKKARVYLVMSLIGVLLSALVFPGIIFSTIGFIGSLIGMRKFADKTYVWGFWIGALGIALNLFMIFGFIIYAIS